MTEHKIPKEIVGIPGWQIYHKPKPKSYAYGSVPSAMRRAKRVRRKGMDWDRRVSKDGHGVWCHQPNPTKGDAWVDPRGVIDDRHEVTELRREQLVRLEFKGEHMMDDWQALRMFKALGLVPMVETKPYKLTKDHWLEFKRKCDALGVVPVIASLPSLAEEKLRPAHEAGLVTLLLWRTGAKVPDFVDLVKSHNGRRIYRVSKRPIAQSIHPKPKPKPKPPAPKPEENPVATTANGHPVIFSATYTGPGPRLRKWKVPGVERHFIARDGAMGFILMHVALWFHEVVERIDKGTWDEWGWAVRPVRGQSTGYSNHAGAVALDINATRHPRGVPITRTMTNKQISLIRSRMRWLKLAVIWGGGWRTPDGMHFEIARISLKRAEFVAKWLMRTRRGKRILDANPGAKAFINS